MNIMKNTQTPTLSSDEIEIYFEKAHVSPRHRYPKILHKQGSQLNQVFNFMLEDSYMQPHLHPGEEKIEKMYLVMGSFAVLFFNDKGEVNEVSLIEKGKCEYIEIPAFTWHTYVMLTDSVVSYETMMGKYDPETWKILADWAPSENSQGSFSYLGILKQKVIDQR